MTNFFNTQSAFQTTTTAPRPAIPAKDDTHQLALTIAEAADDRKGSDIVLLDVSHVSYLADYFVIVTGFSSVQVKAIARSIEDKVQEELGRIPAQVEGKLEGNWVLLDYGDVIAHIFMPDEREFYNLEAFWGHGQQTKFNDLVASLGSH